MPNSVVLLSPCTLHVIAPRRLRALLVMASSERVRGFTSMRAAACLDVYVSISAELVARLSHFMTAALQVPEQSRRWVEQLHAIVDSLTAPIIAAHRESLQCKRGCHACCTDGLTVFAIEAAIIEHHYAPLLSTQAPSALGGCAFLNDAGECRIYAHRPYVCRTQGLPLRWLETPAQPESESQPDNAEPFEARDVCSLTLPHLEPLEELRAEDCWTLGPVEARLLAKQRESFTGPNERVALRSLFAKERRHLPIAPNSIA